MNKQEIKDFDIRWIYNQISEIRTLLQQDKTDACFPHILEAEIKLKELDKRFSIIKQKR